MTYNGCRALSADEQNRILEQLTQPRDKALFTLQLSSGFRIGELLSLTCRDVCHVDESTNKKSVFDELSVQRKSTKKKVAGRTVALNPRGQKALAEWLNSTNAPHNKEDRVFPMTYRRALQIYQKAMHQAGIHGPPRKLGTHCGRKTFAKKIHDKSGGNLIDVQAALGHKSVASTQCYLKFNQEKLQQWIRED